MTNGNVVGEHATRARNDSTLAAVVALGSDVVDETLIGTVSLAQVLRTEAFGVAGAALDWIEAVSKAGFKVGARPSAASTDPRAPRSRVWRASREGSRTRCAAQAT